MAFIGNNVQTQGFTPAIDYFSGNGSTVTFTLSRPVASVAQVIIAIDNVVQNSSTAYSVSGNSITFTSAPLSGTNNIWVQYTSPITTYAAISQDPSVIGDITATGGFLSTGDFGNTYTDGTIVDYVTGNARITTGPADGMTLYNGGTTGRTALAAWDTSGNLNNTGNVGVGVAPNVSKLLIYNNPGYGQFNSGNSAEDGAYPLVGSFNNASVASATYGWGFYDSSSTGNLALYRRAGSTTGLKTLEVNRTNGAVTTPYQPGFNITANSSAFTGTTLPYGGTIFNTGSYFNTSTYTFTAPVAGIYIFGWQFFSPPNTVASVDFLKNGAAIGRYGTESGSLNNYAGWSGSMIINMAANDTAALNRFAGTIHLNPAYSYFCGYLLG